MKIKNALLSLLLAAAVLVSSGCDNNSNSNANNSDNENQQTSSTTSSAAEENAAPESSDAAGGFYVDGTKLFDANGNEFVMRGINHPHSWFKDKLETAIPAIAATGANSVRIVLSDGQQWTKDPIEDVEKIVELCKENKMICILEVHDNTGFNEIDRVLNTVDYWVELKPVLDANKEYIILNISNEWVGNWEADTWYQGYSQAVRKLRDAGIKNALMIDAAGWGQYAEPIGQYGKTLLEEDPDKNIVFSVHMYGAAGKSPRVIEQNLKYATNNGLCIVVGEFGYNHSDGDVDEAYIMKYCTENDIGYLGWSWKGNGGGVEYLDIALDWEGNSLSEDWGENLINGENGIRETSKICSVFK